MPMMKKTLVTFLAASMFFMSMMVHSDNSGQPGSPHDWFHLAAEELFDDARVVELVEAAIDGDARNMDRLVNEGADVNYKGKYNLTPLFSVLASQKWWRNNKRGFLHLLELGANPNLLADDGKAIIHRVSELSTDAWYLEAVLKYGGNPSLPAARSKYNYSYDGSPHPDDFATALHGAIALDIEHKPIEKITLLLKAGANVNAKRANGSTPLDLAVQLKVYDQAYLLLEAGGDCHNQTTGPYYKRLSDKINENNRITLRPSVSSQDPDYWYRKFMGLLKENCLDEWKMVKPG